MKHHEFDLQKAVCLYLSKVYPRVLFLSDTIANVKLTMIQASRNKAIQKEGFKCPDILILEPRGNYCGLFIELKIKSPFKKNGELLKNEHLEGQQRTIDDLNALGYLACFSVGFDETKLIIDNYLKLKTKNNFSFCLFFVYFKIYPIRYNIAYLLLFNTSTGIVRILNDKNRNRSFHQSVQTARRNM